MFRGVGITIGLALASLSAAPVAHAEPSTSPPDLSGYELVDPGPYLVEQQAYFVTPDGLQCGIVIPALAGCFGDLPGAPTGATEVRLGDADERGWRETAGSSFVRVSGAAPVLPVGQKISVDGVECAVSDAGVSCATDNAWFTLSPDGATVGPPTPALPDGFPDPLDYVLSQRSYLVGEGPRNIFPFFAVGDGFTCTILMYSSGTIGCHGPLANTDAGANTIELAFGEVTVSSTPAQFTKPSFPGDVLTLNPGFRVNGYGSQGTCAAVVDGVACYYGSAGFLVTSSETRTFE